MRVSPSGKAPPSQGGIPWVRIPSPALSFFAYILHSFYFNNSCINLRSLQFYKAHIWRLMLEFYIARYSLDEQDNSSRRR